MAAVVVPCLRAIEPRLSPALTVYVRVLLAAPAAPLVEVDAPGFPGIMSFCPTLSGELGRRLFAFARSSTPMPCFLATFQRLSLLTTL